MMLMLMLVGNHVDLRGRGSRFPHSRPQQEMSRRMFGASSPTCKAKCIDTANEARIAEIKSLSMTAGLGARYLRMDRYPLAQD